MEIVPLTIPFEHVRAFAPAEGEPFVVWTGKRNKWPDNRDRFMRHETIEAAIGRGIRAERENRRDEVSMSPGLRCRDGYIHVRGGWRAHKAVRAHNDFFDGRFSFKLIPSLQDNRLELTVSDLDLTWNANLAARIVDFLGVIRRAIIKAFTKSVAREIEDRLERIIEERIEELIRQRPEIGYLLEVKSIRLLRNAVVVTLEFSTEPDDDDDDD